MRDPNDTVEYPISRRRALILACAMAGAAGAAHALRPTVRLSETLPPLDLERQVPMQFDGWQVDTNVTPVLPSPEMEAVLNVLYSQVLARTYVNARGDRVMFTIAYGADQSSETTAVHRPEFCYSAQGFKVHNAGTHAFPLGGRPLEVQRLVAVMGARFEPISYWITLNGKASLPGAGRKLEQLKYGLRGLIPDGALIRVSTVGLKEVESFSVQEVFLGQMYDALSPMLKPRLFGA